ncbi:hypothetical protein OEZ86_013666 [Tetradesmus obliquus]|nr:hypothetical protein OEZ86_013666 [Tetradesmus obliquus]
MLSAVPTPEEGPSGTHNKRNAQHSTPSRQESPAKQQCIGSRMDRANLLKGHDRRTSTPSSSLGASPCSRDDRPGGARRALDFANQAGPETNAMATGYGGPQEAAPLEGPLLRKEDFALGGPWHAACAKHLLSHKRDWVSYKAQKAVAATLTARERKIHPRHPDFKHRTNGDMAVWLDNRQGDANVMRDTLQTPTTR